MARTPEEISIVNTYGNPINPATEDTLQSVLTAVQAGGAILDGVNAAIKATVLDYTNSNPLAVRLSDANGDYVAAGAGTQYTEDAPAAANPIGSSVNLIRSDTPATQTTTDGDNVAQRGTNYGAAYVQVVNSSGAFVDTFGGGTQYADGAVRGTAIGTLAMGDDGTNIQSVKVDSDGNLQIDVLTMPTVAVTGTFYQATQPVSIASMPSTPVTGTFWQATQPVSATDLDIRNLAAATDTVVVTGGAGQTADVKVTLDSETVAIASIAAGTNLIGKMSIDQVTANANEVVIKSITAGDTNIGNVDVVTLPAIPAGTNAIGKLLPSDVDVTTNTNHADKYYTSAGAVTDGIIWSPAAGKRWHITTLYINVSAAATVTIEDDLAGGDVVRWKGELAANSGVVLTYSTEHPFASGEDASDLIITSSAGNIYVQAVGFEI